MMECVMKQAMFRGREAVELGSLDDSRFIYTCKCVRVRVYVYVCVCVYVRVWMSSTNVVFVSICCTQSLAHLGRHQ